MSARTVFCACRHSFSPKVWVEVGHQVFVVFHHFGVTKCPNEPQYSKIHFTSFELNFAVVAVGHQRPPWGDDIGIRYQLFHFPFSFVIVCNPVLYVKTMGRSRTCPCLPGLALACSMQ
jgi:hypothetical protein